MRPARHKGNPGKVQPSLFVCGAVKQLLSALCFVFLCEGGDCLPWLSNRAGERSSERSISCSVMSKSTAAVSLYSSDQRSDGLRRVLIWLQAHTAASRHVQSCLEDTQHIRRSDKGSQSQRVLSLIVTSCCCC